VKSYEPQNQLAKQKLSEKEQETGQRGNLLSMRLVVCKTTVMIERRLQVNEELHELAMMARHRTSIMTIS